MHRLWSRAAITGVCATVAVVLAAAPAQAAPPAAAPAAAQPVHQPAAAGRQPGAGVDRQGTTGEYRERLGRVAAPWNDELTCDGDIWNPHCEWVKHYTYVDMVTPDDVSAELWNRLVDFSRCVVNNAGIAIVATSIATGGVTLAIVVASFAVAADNCGSLTLEEMARATIDIYDAT
jgi:hypothetical protein